MITTVTVITMMVRGNAEAAISFWVADDTGMNGDIFYDISNSSQVLI